MKNYKNFKVNVPETWKDITLENYQMYYAEMRKDLNEATKLLTLIQCFCNISLEEASKLHLKSIHIITKHFNKLFEQIPQSVVLKFKWEGKAYGFIPNFEKLTLGEYADLEFYLSDRDRIWDNMHNVMNVLYREIDQEEGDKYSIKPYNPDNKEEHKFSKLPMNIVYGASNFFLSFAQELSEIIGTYTEEEQEKILKEIARQKQTSGDGME
jgi:hypothetical protein